jgi:D-alanine-D-alanine ligase
MNTQRVAMDGVTVCPADSDSDASPALTSTGTTSCDADPERSAREVLDITVLMGGPSGERDVSIASGSAIADALERTGHKVVRSDISPTNTSALDRAGIDVVFIALHGEFGETGQVQELCESRHLRYTGSPPRASELAMDKAASKQVFRRCGIATPDWVMIEESDPPTVVAAKLKDFAPPVVVKPVDGGSSLDVTIARDITTRNAAIADCTDKYSRAMVEKFVKGREFTVSLLGELALPVLEIITTREFYDYTAKYSDGAGTRYVFEHGLPPQTARRMQDQALLAAKSLGCRDMSRVDFLLDANLEPFVLEINPIPGFTSHSLLPMAAGKIGISFDQLVNRIVDMAMKR